MNEIQEKLMSVDELVDILKTFQKKGLGKAKILVPSDHEGNYYNEIYKDSVVLIPQNKDENIDGQETIEDLIDLGVASAYLPKVDYVIIGGC